MWYYFALYSCISVVLTDSRPLHSSEPADQSLWGGARAPQSVAGQGGLLKRGEISFEAICCFFIDLICSLSYIYTEIIQSVFWDAPESPRSPCLPCLPYLSACALNCAVNLKKLASKLHLLNLAILINKTVIMEKIG